MVRNLDLNQCWQKSRLLLLFVTIGFIGCEAPQPYSQTIYFFRHAEKANQTEEAPLTEMGKERAALIATILNDAKVDRIYSTRFPRNMATIEPLALGKNLIPKVYEWHDWKPMLAEIQANQLELSTIVICGHGDNLLPMIGHLGCMLPQDSLGPYEHDVYFEVQLLGDTCIAKAVKY